MSSPLAVPHSEARHRRGFSAAAVAMTAAVVVSLFVTFVPAWVIQPFRAQGVRELALSLRLVRIAPLVTLVTLAVGLLAVLRLRPRRRGGRIAVSFAVLLLAFSAWLARTDYFEFMFHPNLHPQFVAIGSAGLEDGDMVMVARAGGEARAYPIRTMAYHHLINDTVGGVPLVATY